MRLIKPEYGTDSEEEDDDGSAQAQAEQKQREEAAKAADAGEHKRRTCAEAEKTAAEIMDAFERAAGRLCWVVYHDGGYTPERAATGARAVVGWSEDGGAAEHTAQAAQPERAGWGYMRKVYKSPNQPGTGRPQVLPPCSTEPRHSPVTCHGPVQLDDQANDFSGCVRLSNNTAELSAVLQILAHFLMWKLRNLVEGVAGPHRASL
jgi:hypothetical protein